MIKNNDKHCHIHNLILLIYLPHVPPPSIFKNIDLVMDAEIPRILVHLYDNRVVREDRKRFCNKGIIGGGVVNSLSLSSGYQ